VCYVFAMVVELITQGDIGKARALIERAGLRFEEEFDVLVGAFEGGEMVATGARSGNILKMLAIAPEQQEGSLLGELVTELVRSGLPLNFDSFFVFTRPMHVSSFEALNFRLLVSHGPVALLEHGNALSRYFAAHRHLAVTGENGAVVMNCNPFTRGHRYLIEKAAGSVDRLFVFVVREDRSAFPFEVRLRLVREGVAHLPNVHVLDSSHYAVSSVTFPAYFLKASDPVSQLQIEIDLLLFARHIAPHFHISQRFIGTEPYCRTTRLYSDAMKRILPGHGVNVCELDRLTVDKKPVSAYRVREAIRREAHETLRQLVPDTTMNYLLSSEAAAIREKLVTYDRRH